jgi:squalene synthase HpnC
VTTLAPIAPTTLPPAPDVLDRRHGENFPVAMRLVPGPTRRHLLALYGYARLVDDVGDEASGDRTRALRRIRHEVDRIHAGEWPSHPILRATARSVRDLHLPREPFLHLIEANLRDQGRVDIEDWSGLLAYCRLSANPVGELVLHVFGAATADRIAMSDRICTALQIVEHLQDVTEDARRGRIYLPADERRRAGVSPRDLVVVPAPPAVRRLAARIAGRAGRMLDEGAPLVGTLPGIARLAVAGYVAGGRAAVRSLARNGYRHLDGRLSPARRDVVGGLLTTALRGR